MSPNSLTKGLKDTGHPMKQKFGIQHLLKMIHEISLPFVIRQAKNRCHAYYTMVEMGTNVSSVVAFQGWWVLKSKLFAQESTCSKEILISTSLNHLWFSVDGVIKVDYLDFPCKKIEILCELDVGVIACNF